MATNPTGKKGSLPPPASAGGQKGAPAANAAKKANISDALAELKRQLHYERPPPPTANSSKDGEALYALHSLYSDTDISSYLLRFLLNGHDGAVYTTSEAIDRLKRRRKFELSLPTLSVTTSVVSTLRSGALRVVGRDRCYGRPVLFLNLRSLSPLSAAAAGDEIQRLVIVVLEYMSAVCMMSGNVASTSAGGGGGSAQATPSNNNKNNSNSNSNDSKGTAGRQRFVLLVNEEGVEWEAHQSLFARFGAIAATVDKYYPQLLDLVLLCGASQAVRRGIASALAGVSLEAKKRVQMVPRAGLEQFLTGSATPEELGGQNRPGSSTQSGGASAAALFSEAVLRHWYAATSYVQAEAAGSVYGTGAAVERPLYLPLPPQLGSQTAMLSGVERILLQTQTYAGNASGMAWTPSRALFCTPKDAGASGRQDRAVDGLFSPLEGDADEATAALDDGICSSISLNSSWVEPAGAESESGSESDADLLTAEDVGPLVTSAGRTHNLHRAPHGADALVLQQESQLTAEEQRRVSGEPLFAAELIQRERRARLTAERKLQLAEAGMVVDPRNLSAVEAELARIHQELNIFTAEVILKSKTAVATEAQGNRRRDGKHGSGNGGASRAAAEGPALTQLLDLTLTALENATNSREVIPAMKFAQPSNRGSPAASYGGGGDKGGSCSDDGGCCCIM